MRRWILWILSAALLMTGFLAYTYGGEVNPNDWHSRGIYLDVLRPYWWPLFAGFVVLFVVALARVGNDDQDDNSAVAMN